MRWLATVLVGSLFLGSIERAAGDIPPPPPPKGQKYVTVEHDVVLAKDVKNSSDYVFVEHVAGFGIAPKFRILELSDAKATPISQGGRRIGVGLLTIPAKVAKGYKSTDELTKAIAENKIEGLHRIYFDATTTISTADKRDKVKWTHTITAIKADGALDVKISGDGANQKLSPTSDDEQPNSGYRFIIAGVAATFALAFAGLWLVRRR
jgi:hypothetical protein